MTFYRRGLLTLSAAAAGATIPSIARAQSFPNRTVTIVVPFAPGGNTDLVGRIVATSLGKALGQTVVVDNRPGAGGAVGAGQVARSAPDGHTLLLAGGGVIVTVPEMASTPYTRADFAPLSLVNRSSMVLLARSNDARLRNFADLAAYSRSGEGKLNAGHSGPGTPNHLALLQLENLLGTKFTVVSYRGSGPALSDLLGGQIDVHFDQVTSSLQHIRSGALKALAVLGPTTDPALPEVKTVSQLGFGEIDGTTYIGLLVSSRTPPDLRDRLAGAIREAVADPQMVKSARDLGSEAYSCTPEEFGRILEAEYAISSRAARDGRLKAD
ncbi:Bug family tripartite tricarboxylate transporter substrate binding protein [Pararoseomonas indoligenes]|uniref:Tripartite tricarboxylate transporter substrate binding protein n=1 Tax=Roseomonas indoligenes TaxID=2820811 RepID=A0A940S7D9_9PROT|nr:tripartite tricarboxylate transporter substrate binding protein [Pararoseomonas indoligenes]MBP0496526.1 tripartite tricarboxylate transporter substrate binding protein [Pararoseomonas indoligenes]